MELKLGAYSFDEVTYDRANDVLYAAASGCAPAFGEETPEMHVLRMDARGVVCGVKLVNPRYLLKRAGAIFVTLPSGERLRVDGVDEAIGAARFEAPTPAPARTTS